MIPCIKCRGLGCTSPVPSQFNRTCPACNGSGETTGERRQYVFSMVIGLDQKQGEEDFSELLKERLAESIHYGKLGSEVGKEARIVSLYGHHVSLVIEKKAGAA
jgi:hypothetical protein